MRVLLIRGSVQACSTIDLEILEEAFATRSVHVRHDSLLHLVRSVWQSVREVLAAEVVIAWFGAYHALLPFVVARVLRRKCVVIASGYDVANEPAIDYGNMRPGVRRWIGRAIFGMAHKVLAVSHFTREETLRNVGVAPEKIEVIAHGIPDPHHASAGMAGMPKAPQVLTIAHMYSRSRMEVKGLTLFAQVAARLPDVEFLHVGSNTPDALAELERIAPPNLQIVGPLYGDAMQEIMARSKVYAQLSAYESFCMAVAEAMLVRCIPVVTQRGALPEVVGDVGVQVPYGDIDLTADAIRGALAMPESEGARARARIVAEFAVAKRRDALVQAIRALK